MHDIRKEILFFSEETREERGRKGGVGRRWGIREMEKEPERKREARTR